MSNSVFGMRFSFQPFLLKAGELLFASSGLQAFLCFSETVLPDMAPASFPGNNGNLILINRPDNILLGNKCPGKPYIPAISDKSRHINPQ
jgi:hypothetical protein